MLKRLASLLVLAVILLVPHFACAASKTTAQTGLYSLGSTWIGGVKPAPGDTIIVASGHTLTIDEDCSLGSNAAAVGHAITVNGTLTHAAGVTITLAGYDTGSNTAMYIAEGGRYLPTGGTVLVDCATDYQTYIRSEGDIEPSGVTFSIPTARKNWNNAGSASWSSFRAALYGYNTCIMDLGKRWLSNAAGDGIGTASDSSVTVTGGAFLTNQVASVDALASSGDYYVDHRLGLIYFMHDTEWTPVFVTGSVTYKHLTFNGFGIYSPSSGDRAIFDNCIFECMGRSASLGGYDPDDSAIFMDYKVNPLQNPASGGAVTNCTFRYCDRSIILWDSNTSSKSANRFKITGNTFSGVNMMFYCNYTSSVEFANNTIHTLGALLNGDRLNPVYGQSVGDWYYHHNIGHCYPTLPLSSGVTASDNDITGFGGLQDTVAIDTPGSSTSNRVTVSNNIFRYGLRVARIGSYLDIKDNLFVNFFHHGIVFRSGHSYVTDVEISGNRIVNDHLPASDMSGGFTIGYNASHWGHNIRVFNNTFDAGVRAFNNNDSEGNTDDTYSICAATGLQFYNNILTNSAESIRINPPNEQWTTRMGATRFDHIGVHGTTQSTPDALPATFMRAGDEHHFAARNVAGVELWRPSYTLPMTSGKALQLVVSGTPGVDLSMQLSWGGGTAKELVLSQGTATAGSDNSLTDSGASWPSTFPNWYKARFVRILGGTGAGQSAMIRLNSGTTLITIAQTGNALWAVPPTAGSVYVVLDHEIQLFDSGGTESVYAGIYPPDLPVAAGTYTDSGITIASNYVTADPQYVSRASLDYTPQAAAYDGTGFGGLDLGAVIFSATGGGGQTGTVRRVMQILAAPVSPSRIQPRAVAPVQ